MINRREETSGGNIALETEGMAHVLEEQDLQIPYLGVIQFCQSRIGIDVSSYKRGGNIHRSRIVQKVLGL